MNIGQRAMLGCCRCSTAGALVLIRTIAAVLIIFSLLLPANAQFWEADSPVQRPVAGPVVPLTETRVAPEELVGGDGATPAAFTGATGTITPGEPLAAPSG